jgi:NADH-quinone oxidoreductase subunit M
MSDWSNLLRIAVFLPSVGAVVIALLGPRRCEAEQSFARWIALATSLVTLVLTVFLVANFPVGADEFAVSETGLWFGDSGGQVDIRFSLGLDGLSLWLFGLTSLLMILAIGVSWKAIDRYCRVYYALLLILQTGMMGVFCARDIILFYVFFEATLIPLFFLIGIWGSSQRRYAAIKFFLFTLAGSVLTFLGLLAVVWWHFEQLGLMTFSIPELTAGLVKRPMPVPLQLLVFTALFAGFAIKVPLFPLHTWLPLAHVEAPTAGSVLLAGVLLKIGTYGFVRLSLPLLPDATVIGMPWMLGLSAAGIIYGALVALAQSDIKRLIAYSSVSHLGFCMLGIFALNRTGIDGGVLQMVNHGLSTGGLFALVGMLYERYHTRDIKAYGGLARRLPVLSFFMLLMTLSSIGLPGMNGFAGELLVLVGMFQRAWVQTVGGPVVVYRVISVLAVFGVVLGAWYMLWLFQRVFFGPLREPVPEHHGEGREPIRDLSSREVASLIPLVVLIFWIGLKPSFFLERMRPTLDRLTVGVMRTADGETRSRMDELIPESGPLARGEDERVE